MALSSCRTLPALACWWSPLLGNGCLLPAEQQISPCRSQKAEEVPRKCSTFPKLHENIDFCFSAIFMAILLATTEYFCCSQITLFILTCFISVVVAYLFFPKYFQRFFCFPPTKSCRSRAVQRLCEGGRCVWAWQREEEQSRTEKEAQKAEMWAKLNLRRNAIFQWHQYYL